MIALKKIQNAKRNRRSKQHNLKGTVGEIKDRIDSGWPRWIS